jgi:hypothetical protein
MLVSEQLIVKGNEAKVKPCYILALEPWQIIEYINILSSTK